MWIEDEKAFVFTFKNDNPLKFNILNDKKNEAFHLFDSHSSQMCWIGNDIIVRDDEKFSLYQSEYSCFDYRGIENALIGKVCDVNEYFKSKRILVIQMK